MDVEFKSRGIIASYFLYIINHILNQWCIGLSGQCAVCTVLSVVDSNPTWNKTLCNQLIVVLSLCVVYVGFMYVG